jgi:hypothetical protein
MDESMEAESEERNSRSNRMSLHVRAMAMDAAAAIGVAEVSSYLFLSFFF